MIKVPFDYDTLNLVEVIGIIIVNILDIFDVGCKCERICPKREAENNLSAKEINDASKQINKIIIYYINILKKLKEEEEEKKKKLNIDENIKFEGSFSWIQKNYKELNNMLNN